MTEDIPIIFAKEILGWKDAVRTKGGCRSRARIDAYEGYRDNKCPRSFDYTDIRKVLRYAKWWCDKNEQSYEIFYSAHTKGYGALCAGADAWDESIVIVIMKIIIAANRKIK